MRKSPTHTSWLKAALVALLAFACLHICLSLWRSWKDRAFAESLAANQLGVQATLMTDLVQTRMTAVDAALWWSAALLMPVLSVRRASPR